jgi:hypothetical protein
MRGEEFVGVAGRDVDELLAVVGIDDLAEVDGGLAVVGEGAVA